MRILRLVGVSVSVCVFVCFWVVGLVCWCVWGLVGLVSGFVSGFWVCNGSEFVSGFGSTDAEADRVRKWADHAPQGSRQPLAVALAFASGTATEIARVRIGDIDLDKATVAFAGGAARVGPLADWAAQAVRRYVGDNSPVAVGVPLCVSARTTPEREVESVSGLLRRVLRAAGLYELEGVTASSIRLSSARRVLHADGIVAAAKFLGWTSLDRTADALRHNWRHPDG